MRNHSVPLHKDYDKPTPEIFTEWVSNSLTGEEIEYSRGIAGAAINCRKEAWNAAVSGLVFLYQVRMEEDRNVFSFRARKLTLETGMLLRPKDHA